MSYRVRLTTDQSYELADKLQAIEDRKLTRRLLAISLRHYGYPVKEIARLTGVSSKTVTTWIRLFLHGGFDELLALRYPAKRDSRLAPYEAAISAFWQAHPKATLADLQQWLREQHQVTVEYSWLYRYLEAHHLRPPPSDRDAEG